MSLQSLRTYHLYFSLLHSLGSKLQLFFHHPRSNWLIARKLHETSGNQQRRRNKHSILEVSHWKGQQVHSLNTLVATISPRNKTTWIFGLSYFSLTLGWGSSIGKLQLIMDAFCRISFLLIGRYSKKMVFGTFFNRVTEPAKLQRRRRRRLI